MPFKEVSGEEDELAAIGCRGCDAIDAIMERYSLRSDAIGATMERCFLRMGLPLDSS